MCRSDYSSVYWYTAWTLLRPSRNSQVRQRLSLLLLTEGSYKLGKKSVNK